MVIIIPNATLSKFTAIDWSSQNPDMSDWKEETVTIIANYNSCKSRSSMKEFRLNIKKYLKHTIRGSIQ